MAFLGTASILMDIDEPRTIETIEAYLRQLLERQGCRGFVLGLSGGLDSTLLTALAVRAVGRERVHVFFLFDRDSAPWSERDAECVAEWLGLTLERCDITPVMRTRGVYRPLALRLSVLSPRLNRGLSWLYQRIAGESPFVSSLRAGAGELDGGALQRWLFAHLVRPVEESFNFRHRYRRELLERIARDAGYQLIGAANHSEAMVGWFVKNGIDDLPIQPLLGLYKTQVRQLARYLEVPEAVLHRRPSPDMLRGMTDELGLQMPYRQLDEVLDAIHRQLDDAELLDHGIEPAERRTVEELHRLSAWKRASPHETPPVDGRAGSAFRSD